MSCPTSDETKAVFDENSGFEAAYIVILIFVGISTITTWIFYTRVGVQGIILNVIYTIGFIFCIIGIAANSWVSILILTIALIVDILGAIMMSILLYMDKIPQDLLDKFPFTPLINKIIFVSFATSQTIIVIVLCLILDAIFAKC
mmetsp:Transcript_59775/g.53824  ORF Transcript_59775/g.53824 Transcript_59775/m.53824 type:complete len:145 (+) Transcript_59775:26-460(+)